MGGGNIMPPENLQKIRDLFAMVTESITKKQFLAAFDLVMKSVAAVEKNLVARIEARLALIKNGKDGRDGKNGEDGKDGKSTVGPAGPKGEKGDAIVGPAGKNGKDGSPDAPEDIVRKLETLVGEGRLDASAIKNLPEFAQKVVHTYMGAHGNLWNLSDVYVAGIVAGQALQWDGTKWVAYTPPGSSGTPVWAENLATQGAGKNFTLAHTPIAGSVRLFRGGAYQAVPTDYTISGSAITLVYALASGETLVADYSY